MRKILSAGLALGFGIALSVASATACPSAGSTIVVGPGQSIQAAVNQAQPGDTVLVKPGVYHQTVQIRTDGITLRGSGDFLGGTVLKPPASPPHSLCASVFGPTGVCILAKKLNPKTAAVIQPVYDDTVTGLYVTGFPAFGVFGFGTYGMTVQRVAAFNDGAYGIARFESTKTLFANNIAVGDGEAGLYVGDSPNAATVVRDNVTKDNALGIFVRHARGVTVMNNRATGNCQGVLVLDDGGAGGSRQCSHSGQQHLPQQQVLPAERGSTASAGRRHPAARRHPDQGHEQQPEGERGPADQLRRNRRDQRRGIPRKRSAVRHDRPQHRFP